MTETRRSAFWPALAGGVIGSAATALVLFLAAPQLIAGRIVRDGLMADPQILVETAEALREQQYAPLIESRRAALEAPFGSSWKGAARPEVVLVEFFDYACGYCRASRPHVDRLLKENDDLRVVYRELPILGPNSVSAARLSLAASKAGRFRTFHDALNQSGRPADDTIAAAAQAAGIDAKVPEDPQIEAELRRNFELAGQLGGTGTPMFVVGDRVLNGAVGYEALKAAVEAARS